LAVFGFNHVLEIHPTMVASNWIRVPQVEHLLRASFRFCLATDTLAFSYDMHSPAPVQDFHRIDNAHAGRTIIRCLKYYLRHLVINEV